MSKSIIFWLKTDAHYKTKFNQQKGKTECYSYVGVYGNFQAWPQVKLFRYNGRWILYWKKYRNSKLIKHLIPNCRYFQTCVSIINIIGIKSSKDSFSNLNILGTKYMAQGCGTIPPSRCNVLDFIHWERFRDYRETFYT